MNPSRVHIYMTEDKRLFHTIARELADVNNILSKMVAIGKDGLSLKELFILSDFVARYLNTAKLIENAEELAHIDALLLQSDAKELSVAVEDFMRILPSAEKDLYNIDVKHELDAYDKEQAIPYNTEREKAQSLWKQLSLARRVFDYTPFDTEEYKELEVATDQLEKDYNASHNKVNQLYSEYQEKRLQIAHLYYFEGTSLVMLVAQLGDIARSIILDIDNLRKEGRV